VLSRAWLMRSPSKPEAGVACQAKRAHVVAGQLWPSGRIDDQVVVVLKLWNLLSSAPSLLPAM
jgi:hypothetical protein